MRSGDTDADVVGDTDTDVVGGGFVAILISRHLVVNPRGVMCLNQAVGRFDHFRPLQHDSFAILLGVLVDIAHPESGNKIKYG